MKNAIILKERYQDELQDEFRVLKTHLLTNESFSGLKAIMITSATHKEGASTIAANIAKSFAEDGLRVLLIDANYRKNKISFLSDGLIKQSIDVNGTRLNISYLPNINNMFIMSEDYLNEDIKEDNTTWLIKTNRLLSLILHMKEVFDKLIIDSSPILNLSESLMIASHMDGIILTVRADSTKRQVVIKAKDELIKVNANILGVILNRKRHIIPSFFYKGV